MRQAAQLKMGFYPAHPDAVAAIASHLRLGIPKNERESISIIDPCCGEGLAIKQIGQALGVPESQTFAVELDATRAERARENMPGANVIGPASFTGGVRISHYSFGLVYCNPPFDDELGGGGREEENFARRAANLLEAGGILVMVLPERALARRREFVIELDSRFESIRVFKFPAHVRHYKEWVVIGRKRRKPLNSKDVYAQGSLISIGMEWRSEHWDRNLGSIDAPTYTRAISDEYNRYGSLRLTPGMPHIPYTIPAASRPSLFCKVAYTDDELVEVLERSPLNRILAQVRPDELARPPKPPGKGHVALLLASGLLDGLVESAEHGNHVVRGTAKKEWYLNEAACKSVENADTGMVTTTEVYSQKVVLTIRAVWPDGTIQTFTDEPPKDDAKAAANGPADQVHNGPAPDDEDREAAAETIRKLFRMTEANGVTPAEAENARDKIESIAAKWDLDLHSVVYS